MGNASVAFLALVLVPIYTYSLDVADFGLLALMLAVYGLLGRFYDFGIMNAVGRFYFDSQDGETRYSTDDVAVSTMLYLTVQSVLLSASLWFLAPQVSSLVSGNADAANLVRIVSITLLADAVSIPPLTLIRMEERTRLYVVVTTARFAAGLLLNILFVVVLQRGVAGILVSHAITSVGLLLVLAPEIWRRRKGLFSRSLIRAMLSFGLPFLPVPLSIWVIDFSDRYLLEVLASREQVGLYAVGYKVAQVLQLAVVAFSMGWAPIRYQIYEREDAKFVFGALASYYVLVMALLGVAIGLVGREVVSVVAPEEYAEASAVIPLLVLSYALYGMFSVLVTGMGVTKRTAPMAGIGVAGALTNVALNLVLIPRFGMMAAAASTVAANTVLAGGAWIFSHRVYPIEFEWWRWAKVLAWAVLVTWAGAVWEPDSVVLGVLAAAGLVVLYVAGLFVIGAVRVGDLRALWEWLLDLRMRLRAPG